MYSKYDSLDPSFQPAHLDTKYGFGLILLTSTRNSKIDSMRFYFKEPSNKNRYDLISAEFLKTSIKNGVKTHEFKVTLNKGTLEDENVSVTNLSGLKMMSISDIIDLHIKSDDPNIQSVIYNDVDQDENGFTDFGQQFCKTIVINP